MPYFFEADRMAANAAVEKSKPISEIMNNAGPKPAIVKLKTYYTLYINIGGCSLKLPIYPQKDEYLFVQ